MKPERVYLLTYLALLLLFLVAWGMAYLPLGFLQLPLSLFIAGAKFALIVLIFMELRQSPPLTRVFGIIGAFWLGILLVLSLSDYMSRNWTDLPSRWPQRPQGAEISPPSLKEQE